MRWCKPVAVLLPVILAGGAVFAGAGCAAPATDPTVVDAYALRAAEVAAQRQQVIDRAEAYAAHRWSGGVANAFHGEIDGYPLDTPDASQRPATGWSLEGDDNVGVSYQWGGFSSLEQFDRGVADGMWAGHLPVRGGAPPTRKAVGVDCSGLVSRVWGLSNKQSTNSLPRICVRLHSYDELQPADVLNRAGHHTMIFKEWVGEGRQRLRVIESTARQGRVHESVHPRDELQEGGYLPLRYRAFVLDRDAP